METKQIQSYHVVFSDGEYVGKVETISAQAPAGHILVKVAYSTCDPYDGICSELFKIEGQRLGGEGSGVIISVGEGVDAGLLNKKISFHGGSWAQYRILNTAVDHIIILNDDQDLSKAAAAYINPVTAIG